MCWTGGKEDEAGGFLARARRGGHVFDVFATMRSRPQSRKAIGDGLEVKRFKVSLSPHCTTLVRKVRSRADRVSAAGKGVFKSDALSVSVSSYHSRVRTEWLVAGRPNLR